MERLENVTGKLDFPVTIGGNTNIHMQRLQLIIRNRTYLRLCENPTKHVFSITEQQQKKL